MSLLDIAALGLFALCWLGYQPVLVRLARGGGGINSDLTVIRAAWMRNMAARENRFVDVQLIAQALNSATFFASSNLLLIAATAGALFGGDVSFRRIASVDLFHTASRMLFEVQVATVLVALARGLLDFIWSIRQMNYSIAAIGAAPAAGSDPETLTKVAALTARILNPALSSFNAGIRGYYFALAAAAWLFGPWAFMAATLGAVTLLLWRQRRSSTARAIRELRAVLEEDLRP